MDVAAANAASPPARRQQIPPAEASLRSPARTSSAGEGQIYQSGDTNYQSGDINTVPQQESRRPFASPVQPAVLSAWCTHAATHGDLQRHPKSVRNQLPPVYLVIASSLASTLPGRHLLGGTLLLSHCAWKTQVGGG